MHVSRCFIVLLNLPIITAYLLSLYYGIPFCLFHLNWSKAVTDYEFVESEYRETVTGLYSATDRRNSVVPQGDVLMLGLSVLFEGQ